MPDNDDLSGAVEALFTSAEWERRLAEARESRRKILAEKAKPPAPEPQPAAPRAIRRSYVALGVLAVAGGLALIWPSPPQTVPQQGLRYSLAPTYAPIPLSHAVADMPILPMRYDLPAATTPQREVLTFAQTGAIPEAVMSTATAPLPTARLVAMPDGLPLVIVPPATSGEIYADLLARLRVAAQGTTLRVHVPADAAIQREDMQVVTSPFAAPSDVVRFYHAGDADAANAAARAIGAEAQDFTTYAPTPPEGVLEVWLSAR